MLDLKAKLHSAFLLICLILLSINIIGVSGLFSVTTVRSSSSEVGVAGYDYAITDARQLLNRSFEGVSAEALNLLVFNALEHNKTRRIGFQENWLLWFIGKFYPPSATTQYPERIASGGIGLCSEASLLLNHLAEQAGFDTRFAKFPAHITSEIKTPDGWRYFDPDYGIDYPVGFLEFSAEEVSLYIENELKQKGFDEGRINSYKEAVLVNGKFEVYSVDHPLSPSLFLLENVADWLVWVIPLLVFGLVWLKRINNNHK